MPPDDIRQQLRQSVLRFLLQQGSVVGDAPLLVAVSGGADSVCLLHVLLDLQDELGLHLHIAHLNHQLRGEESDGDADYVLRLAQSAGVPSTIARSDVADYQRRNRVSEEEAARNVRYGFLADVARSLGASAVAVGHTADDQAETLLLHLIRGTGLMGLAGMQPIAAWPVGDHPGLKVVRPLMTITRAQTQAYCQQRGLSPRTDSTNISSKYLRNRLRSELMPVLERYNPGIGATLSRTAQTVAADMAHISQEVSALWGSVVWEDSKGVVVDNAAFAALSPALKRHLLRAAVEKLAGTLRGIGQVHIEDMIDVLGQPAGKRLSLPHGLTFHGDYAQSCLMADEPLSCRLPFVYNEAPLNIPGETMLFGWKVTTRISVDRPSDEAIRSQSSNHAWFDADVVGNSLSVRTRRNGDRFQPLGMHHSRKLQDFMVDTKISRHVRDRVPLLCTPGEGDGSDEIIWVVDWRIAERAKVTAATVRFLEIEFNHI